MANLDFPGPIQAEQRLEVPIVIQPEDPISTAFCDSICGIFERGMTYLIDGAMNMFIEKPVAFLHHASDAVIQLARNIFEIFFRLLIAPEFDPTSPQFIEQLNELGTQAVQLHQRYVIIREALPPGSQVEELLNQLIQYHIEISAAWDKVNKYHNAIVRCNHLNNLPPEDLNNFNTIIDPIFRSLFETARGFSILIQQNEAHFTKSFNDLIEGLSSAGVRLHKNFTSSFREVLKLLDYAYRVELFTDRSWEHVKRPNFLHLIESLENGIRLTHLPPEAPQPLRNLGNTCYVNATLQAVLAIDGIDYILSNPRQRNEEGIVSIHGTFENEVAYNRLEAMRQEMYLFSQARYPTNQDLRRNQFLSHAETCRLIQRLANPPSNVGSGNLNLSTSDDPTKPRAPQYNYFYHDLLFMMNQPQDIREQADGLTTGDLIPANYNRQIDAFNFFGAIAPVLPCHFHVHNRLTSLNFPGHEFFTRPELENKLIIPLKQPLTKQQFVDQLDRDVRNSVSEQEVDQQYQRYLSHELKIEVQMQQIITPEHVENQNPGVEFDPHREPYSEQFAAVRVVDPDQVGNDLDVRFEESYNRQTSMVNLPEILPLQLGRFRYDETTRTTRKISTQISLPENGIIDLTEFQDANPGEERPRTMYRVVSYVEHIGVSADSGHYISYVNKNGRYYRCNDRRIEEVNRVEFLSNKQAYLVLLQRLTPEQVVLELDRRDRQEALRVAQEADAAERAAAQQQALQQ